MAKPIIKKQATEAEFTKTRLHFIGGSDVPTILGVNNYKCAGELFFEKVGISEIEKKPSIATEMGHILEPVAVDFWSYYNGDGWDALFERKAKKERVYNPIVYKKRIEHPDFPYLACHVDRLFSKSGKIDRQTGILEVKTKSSFVTSNWENGIPPLDFVQLQTYLMITGLSFGQICVMVDARDLIVQEYQADRDLHQEIDQKCKAFWKNVLEARKIWFSNQSGIEKMKAIRDLEPQVDISPRWIDWLKESYKPNNGLILEGTTEILELAKEHQDLQLHIKETEGERQHIEAKIKQFMGEAVMIDFGDLGVVTWKLEGKNRVFRSKIKQNFV